MKKQLLIAAVAATMGTAAIADISMTGNMKVNYANVDNNGTVTNKNTHETNLVISGSKGDTKVHMEFSMDADSAATSGSGVESEDVWLSTKIGPLTAKAGVWNGTDSILSADSARAADDSGDKYSVSGSIANFDITFEGRGGATTTPEGSTATTVSTTLGGVKLTVKNESEQNQYKASGSISGLNYAFHTLASDTANSDKTSFEASYDVNGITVSYAQAEADSVAIIGGDAYFGNVATLKNKMEAGDDVKGFGLKGSIGGNTVTYKHIEIDDVTASQDSTINKFIVTRALAAGTTFEMTYSEEDNDTASLDQDTLDLELSVTF